MAIRKATAGDKLRVMRSPIRPGDRRVVPEMELAFPRPTQSGMSSGPFIPLSETIPAYGKALRVSLFTWTSKMNCASFSLPAGLPKYLGTCPVASERVARRLQKDLDGFPDLHPALAHRDPSLVYVCDVCYAKKNRYGQWGKLALKQRITKIWTDKTLDAGSFAPLMTEAVAFLAEPVIRKVLAKSMVDSGFFRICDSGDVYREDLYLAWCEIARNLPRVRFWLPTRMWVFRRFRELVVSNPPPPNLTVRPSGLFISAHPVPMEGFAMPTATIPAQVSNAWNCPAFDGAKTESCTVNSEGIECRRCWTHPATLINYWTK